MKYDLRFCTLGDILKISINYKIYLRIKRCYLGKLPRFSEILSMYFWHILPPSIILFFNKKNVLLKLKGLYISKWEKH